MDKKLKKLLGVFCALVLIFALVPTASAVNNGTKGRYDPAVEGITSSYYAIDVEKGYITGIAPGTTAQKLQAACLPAGVTASQQKLATGTKISVQIPEHEEPPAEETTEPSVEETTETPTEETTEAPTEEPTEETTEAPTEEPTEETTEAPTEEPTEETTQTPSEEHEEETEPNTDTPVKKSKRAVRAPAMKTHTLTVIVTGDLNGDGAITITDMLMLKGFILGKSLSDTAKAASDVNYDGSVSITDFLRVKTELLGIEKITAGRKAGTAPSDPLLLMTPKGTAKWTPAVTPAAYASDNEALATIDASGRITAASSEGSTFVYALDNKGAVLARAVVTVLSEKLTVSLNTQTCRILAGKTQKLTATLNHPVTAKITWSSSDTAVASVDATGKVSAHKAGTAVISAALEGGNTAKATVTVVPPITAVTAERSIHKIKPGANRTIKLELVPAGVDEEFTWTSSDSSVAKVNQDGVVTGVKFGTVTITAKGKYSGLTATCKVKVCNAKQIAITFDDGPSEYTPKLLDYLKKNNIKVTFFLVGNRLSSYPETLKRQVAEGHEIGYHSYAHVEQTTLSSAQITSDFEKSEAVLKKITGAEFTVWRSPGGGYNDRVLKAIDLPHIMWSVDSYDWKVRNTERVYRNIMNQAHDGGIVLIHDLYSFSVNGAIKAMDELAAGDYEFVTVTEILSRKGTPPKPSTNYFRG